MKKFLAQISDIKNAMRVLEIMDRCGCDIEEVDGMNYYRIKPKYYVSRKDAEDLKNIIAREVKFGRLFFQMLETVAGSYKNSYMKQYFKRRTK